jgi:carbamoyl-phosphate synthase large subunit
MPKRTDISSILVIGAGPIVIGQACEFDYSGTQAIKALKEGAIASSWSIQPGDDHDRPELADATYVEPITPAVVAKIIEKERPDASCRPWAARPRSTPRWRCSATARWKFGVTMIGADADAIDKAEDRQKFKDAMTKIGLESPARRSRTPRTRR